VERLAREAAVIAIAIDETEGIRWELKLTTSRSAEKTLFLLPPKLTKTDRAANLLSWVVGFLEPTRRLSPEVVRTFFATVAGPVLGWRIDAGGDLIVFTADETSEVAYAQVIRRFLMSVPYRSELSQL
jgi:hypothetical protein